MSENYLRATVLLNLQSAMLGEVFPRLRCVTCSWSPSEVIVRVIVDGEIGEEDSESIECVHSEMIASLPEGFNVSVECVRIDSPLPFNRHLLTACGYMRREG